MVPTDATDPAVLLDHAERLVRKSDFATAAAIAAQVLSLDTVAPEHVGWAKVILGRGAHARSEHDTAVTYFREALSLGESSEAPKTKARALLGLGASYGMRGLYDDAIASLREALDNSDQSRFVQGKILAMSALGYTYCMTGNFGPAESYLKDAVEIAERVGSDEVGQAYSRLGELYQHLSDYPQALIYFNRALHAADRTADIGERVNALMGLAAIYLECSDYSAAFESMYEALMISEGLSHSSGIATALGNLGQCFARIQDWQRAIEYELRAEQLHREIGKLHGCAISLGNIGLFYMRLGMLDEASRYVHAAHDLNVTHSYNRGIGVTKVLLADLDFEQGSYQDALNGYRDALEYHTEVLGSRLYVAGIDFKIGNCLLKQGRIQEALARYNSALELANGLGQRGEMFRMHSAIAEAQAALGDTALAYEHLTTATKLEKELLSNDTRKMIESLNIRRALSEERRERERAEAKAAEAERNLANTAIHLAAQTEMLATFRDELRTIVREIDEPIAALKQVKAKLKELPCESVDWGKFEQQFIAVHPSFRSEIEQRCPELTKQEIKMCQLARLGLKTHEMAQLLCLSERTIESHRYGLRKKLRIPSEENLASFLRKI